MLEAQKWVEVLDLREWLPTEGETFVEFFTVGFFAEPRLKDFMGSSVVVIKYNIAEIEYKKELLFKSDSDVYVSTWPGPYTLRINYLDDAYPPGVLVEYPNSEAAQEWCDYWKSARSPKMIRKHFEIKFANAGFRVIVFAEDFILNNI